jgi:hypothetical protein
LYVLPSAQPHIAKKLVYARGPEKPISLLPISFLLFHLLGIIHTKSKWFLAYLCEEFRMIRARYIQHDRQYWITVADLLIQFPLSTFAMQDQWVMAFSLS